MVSNELEIASIERVRHEMMESCLSDDAKRNLSEMLDRAHSIVNGGADSLVQTNLALTSVIKDVVYSRIAYQKMHDIGEKSLQTIRADVKEAIRTALGEPERLAAGPPDSKLVAALKGIEPWKWPLAATVSAVAIFSPHVPLIIDFLSKLNGG